jgi:hypothetical protein
MAGLTENIPKDEVQNERQNLCTNFLGSRDLNERSGKAGKQMKWGGNGFYITVVAKTKRNKFCVDD